MPSACRQTKKGMDDGIALATMDIFAGCGGLSEGLHQAGAAFSRSEPSVAVGLQAMDAHIIQGFSQQALQMLCALKFWGIASPAALPDLMGAGFAKA